MLKLISGTLVGGVKYSDLYIDSNENEEITSEIVLCAKKTTAKDQKNTEYLHYIKLHEK